MIKKITQETSLGWEGALSVTLLYTQIDFFGGSDGKASVYNVGDPGSIPGLGIFPGERKDNPLQYSCLGNPMYREEWQATVQTVTKSWTGPNDQAYIVAFIWGPF